MITLQKQKRIWFALIVTAVYVAVSAVLIALHEPWQDEANPWQIAKEINLTNWQEVLSVEGHPPLWYFILAPFAQAGLPFITLHIIALVVMALAVWLLAYKSPFRKVTIIIFTLSAGFFYFNPVIARDYCLVALAAVTICCLYQRRTQRPILYTLALIFLAESHYLALGLAVALAGGFLIELIKAKKLWPVAAALIMLAAAGYTLAVPAIGTLADHTIIHSTTQAPVDYPTFSHSLNEALYGTAIPMAELTLAITALYLLIYYRKQLAYLVISVGFFICTLTLIYYSTSGLSEKSSLLVIFVLVAVWTARAEQRKPLRRLEQGIGRLEMVKLARHYLPLGSVCLLVPLLSIPHTLAAAINDVTQPYSYSTVVAEFANQSLPEGATLVAPSDGAAGTIISVAPQLTGGRQIYNAPVSEFMGYVKYDYADNSLDDAALQTLLSAEGAAAAGLGEDVYLALRRSSCVAASIDEYTVNPEWTEVATFDPGLVPTERQLVIYRVRSAGL